MSTQLFPRVNGTSGSGQLWYAGGQLTNQAGSLQDYFSRDLLPTRGSGKTTLSISTVNGPTSGVDGANAYISEPVDQDFTLSGTITFNIWALENSMSANAAINAYVDRIAGSDGSITRIATSARTTELGTSSAAANFTVTPTSTAMKRGDRLRFVYFIDDAGTMASGFFASVDESGPTAAAAGDTYVQFTETFGFETTTPAGTQLFFTDTASAVSDANVNKEAWTSRGAGATSQDTTSVAGPTSGVVQTTTAGTTLRWYTRQLQAFTLGGLATVQLRAAEQTSTTNATPRLRVYVTDADGSNPVAWAESGVGAETSTTEGTTTFKVCGASVSVTDGQRLRFDVVWDDPYAATMGGSVWLRLYYGGSAGGSGDTFVTLSQSVSEYSSNATGTAASAFGWADGASGAAGASGDAASAFGWADAASGTYTPPPATGTAASAFGWADAAVGTEDIPGAAASAFGAGIAAAGTEAMTGTAASAFGAGIAAVGAEDIPGAAASAFGWADAASGAAGASGAAASAFGAAIAAVGTEDIPGVAASAFGWADAAAGAEDIPGAAASAFGWADDAAGDVTASGAAGAAASAFGWADDAAGAEDIPGTAASAFGFATAASGAAGAVGAAASAFGAGIAAAGGEAITGAAASAFGAAIAAAGIEVVSGVAASGFGFATAGAGAEAIAGTAASAFGAAPAGAAAEDIPGAAASAFGAGIAGSGLSVFGVTGDAASAFGWGTAGVGAVPVAGPSDVAFGWATAGAGFVTGPTVAFHGDGLADRVKPRPRYPWFRGLRPVR